MSAARLHPVRGFGTDNGGKSTKKKKKNYGNLFIVSNSCKSLKDNANKTSFYSISVNTKNNHVCFSGIFAAKNACFYKEQAVSSPLQECVTFSERHKPYLCKRHLHK